MSMSSSDRERWIAARRAHVRRRLILTGAGLAALAVAGTVVVRLAADAGLGDMLGAPSVVAAAEAANAEADGEGTIWTAPTLRVRVGGRAVPAERSVDVPAGDLRAPGIAVATEREDATERAPFLGEVVEVGVTTPVAPKSFPARLRNPDEVTRLVREHYPSHLRTGGYGGTVVVSVRVDEQGGIEDIRLARASAIHELNAAARAVAARMKFSPEQRMGRITATWIEVPLVFMP